MVLSQNLDFLMLHHSFILKCIFLEEKMLILKKDLVLMSILMIYGLWISKLSLIYIGSNLNLKVTLLLLDMGIL